MSVHILFPTLVFEETLEDLKKHNQALIDKAYKIKEQAPETDPDWRCDTYSTLPHYNLEQDNDSVVHRLINLFGNKVMAFSRNWGMDPKKIICNDFWINIAAPGDYQEYHKHARSHFSLAYYLQTDKGCGNIVFKNPSDHFDMFPLPVSARGSLTDASFGTFAFEPEENKLLIFRSTLSHMVEKNKSNRDRISVTMNFSFEDN